MAKGMSREREPLPPGTKAPSFRGLVTPDQKLSLEECIGSPLVIMFYPADWSPVCSGELGVFNELEPELERHGARLIGISCDGAWCHVAFAEDRKLWFPLVSDFHPKGAISRAYGVYREDDGVCDRALFVIDDDGVVVWSHVSPIAVNPGVDGVLAALEHMSERRERRAQLAEREPSRSEVGA